MMPKFPEKKAAPLRRPPAHSEEPSLDKKRKRLDKLLSSSTSAQKNAPGEPSAPNTSEVEIFDALVLALFVDAEFCFWFSSQ
jgi:hypothetical protein